MAIYLPSSTNTVVGKTGPPGKTYPGIIPFSQGVNVTIAGVPPVAITGIGYSNSSVNATAEGDVFKSVFRCPNEMKLTKATIGVYVNDIIGNNIAFEVNLYKFDSTGTISYLNIIGSWQWTTADINNFFETDTTLSIDLKKGDIVNLAIRCIETTTNPGSFSGKVIGGIIFE